MPVSKKQGTLGGKRSQEFTDALDKLSSGAKKKTEFDLPIAGNVIEWTIGKEFLDFPDALNLYGQVGLLLDIEQILCPVCNLYLPHLDAVQYVWGKTPDEIRRLVLLRRDGDTYTCPKCGITQEEFRAEGLLRDYSSALICIGMRGSKSITSAIYATYLEHSFIAQAQFDRDGLVKALGLAKGTTLEASFVASTGEQTEKTTWDYFRNFRERSPWTNRYVSKVKTLEKRQPRTGMQPWSYSETDKGIYNELLGVKFLSLHSNSGGLAGATRLFVFLDEIARMDLTASKRGADEVWRVLGASLMTVKAAASASKLPKCMYGFRIVTSSPLSVDDKIMVMVKKAQEGSGEDFGSTLVYKKATWNFNNFLPRSEFDQAFAEDPVQAERDFGANPPLAETPFIDDVQRFSKSIEYGLTPSVLLETTYPVDALGREYVGIKVTDAIISPEVPRFFCLDAGSNFDAFSGAMAHPGWVEVMPDKDDEDQSPRTMLLTIYDMVFRILPEASPKRTVWFDSIVDVIRELKDKFRITRVTFDRWNSISLVQDIRSMGIEAEEASINTQDFLTFRADAYGGKIKLLPPLPSDKMSFVGSELRMGLEPNKMSGPAVGIYELVKLSRSDDLKRIFNPNKGRARGHDSDDTAQVIVGVHRAIQDAMSDNPDKQGIKERRKRENYGSQMFSGGHTVQARKDWSVTPGVNDPSGRPQRPNFHGSADKDTEGSLDGRPSYGRVVRVRKW